MVMVGVWARQQIASEMCTRPAPAHTHNSTPLAPFRHQNKNQHTHTHAHTHTHLPLLDPIAHVRVCHRRYHHVCGAEALVPRPIRAVGGEEEGRRQLDGDTPGVGVGGVGGCVYQEEILVFVCVCMYVCVCICVWACMHVCMCVCARTTSADATERVPPRALCRPNMRRSRGWPGTRDPERERAPRWGNTRSHSLTHSLTHSPHPPCPPSCARAFAQLTPSAHPRGGEWVTE